MMNKKQIKEMKFKLAKKLEKAKAEGEIIAGEPTLVYNDKGKFFSLSFNLEAVFDLGDKGAVIVNRTNFLVPIRYETDVMVPVTAEKSAPAPAESKMKTMLPKHKRGGSK